LKVKQKKKKRKKTTQKCEKERKKKERDLFNLLARSVLHDMAAATRGCYQREGIRRENRERREGETRSSTRKRKNRRLCISFLSLLLFFSFLL